MAKGKLKLDHAGIAAMLKSHEVAQLVHAEAERIAAELRTDGDVVRHEMQGDVIVTDYVTDRAASAVTLAHPGGLGMEAKHASLTRAAGDGA